MRLETEFLEIPRGSDLLFDLPIVDDNDDPIDMTGWTVSIFEITPSSTYATENATVVWTDQSEGTARFALPWDAALPEYLSIRLRFTRTSDGHDDGVDPINVRFV